MLFSWSENFIEGEYLWEKFSNLLPKSRRVVSLTLEGVVPVMFSNHTKLVKLTVSIMGKRQNFF